MTVDTEVNGNGKQLQIDYLRSNMEQMDGKLDRIQDTLNNQQMSLATYIAGRATTCPNKPIVDQEIKAMCNRFDDKLDSMDKKLNTICEELNKKADKDQVVKRSEIKLVWTVLIAAITAIGGILGIINFWH